MTWVIPERIEAGGGLQVALVQLAITAGAITVAACSSTMPAGEARFCLQRCCS